MDTVQTEYNARHYDNTNGEYFEKTIYFDTNNGVWRAIITHQSSSKEFEDKSKVTLNDKVDLYCHSFPETDSHKQKREEREWNKRMGKDDSDVREIDYSGVLS